MPTLLPATKDISATVKEEVALRGGTLSDEAHKGGPLFLWAMAALLGDTRSERVRKGERLFLRAVLPLSKEVRPGDIIEGGIAIKVVGRTIRVCPYLFRQVCRNGAIMPHAGKARDIERVDFAASSEAIEAVEEQLREAVRSCAAPEVFAEAARQVRNAAAFELPSGTMDLLLSSQETISEDLREEVRQRFVKEADDSLFGLMNAVTSVARDQKNAEIRWDLEELGGSVPALRLPRVRPGGAAKRATVAASSKLLRSRGLRFDARLETGGADEQKPMPVAQ